MAVEGELVKFAERYRSVVEQRERTDELIKVSKRPGLAPSPNDFNLQGRTCFFTSRTKTPN